MTYFMWYHNVDNENERFDRLYVKPQKHSCVKTRGDSDSDGWAILKNQFLAFVM